MFAASKTAAPAAAATYIEDVFSTYLYTGNGSTQTITNGIDLSTYGGLVWMKRRSTAANHQLYDTARGATKKLASNETTAEATETLGLTAFNSTGFALGSDSNANGNGSTYASWTFRKQAKFFDVVTYTGNGTTQNIAHSLGSTPGCIIVKSYSSGATYDWAVYHRSLGATKGVYLNTTQAEQTNNSLWNDTTPTSTQFTVGNSGGASSSTNANGVTYVAYLFAHDAGGFGLTGADNVISCGSFTNSGPLTTVNLGWEPQYVLTKVASTTGNWQVYDSIRGFVASGGNGSNPLFPNTPGAESSGAGIYPTSTGFQWEAGLGTYIYIAIRRGPMKTPTTGTSVFSPVARSGTGSTTAITTPGFAPDALFSSRTINSGGYYVNGTVDKLRGAFGLEMTDTVAENAFSANADLTGWSNVGYGLGPNSGSNLNQSGLNYIDWVMQRAPGFFDVVCWTGNDVAGRNLSHNLGVAPEFMITKARGGTYNWTCWHSSFGNTDTIPLNTNFAKQNTPPSSSLLNTNGTSYVAPTASVFTVGLSAFINSSSFTYVAYLFATVAGVSKVGSYTGTGALQTINCGFTGGARFVLIKRTDSTGDWYVWDSARGIVAGNDPYLRLNSRAAEVTNTDWVDTHSPGFELSNSAGNLVNSNGGTYIYLAIA